MFKKRNIKHSTRRREIEEDESEPVSSAKASDEEETPDLPLEDLLALRKLRKAKKGIALEKLNKGEVKKKRKKAEDEEEEEEQYGLQKARAPQRADSDDGLEEDNEEVKARKLVMNNNFTQQTNKLDVDKHMMAYIEENMRALRGETAEKSKKEEDAPYDPHAQLYQIDDRYKPRKKELEEGNVTNSVAMLTAIPEVDLGIDVRLKNIEETEKAKRMVEDEKKARTHNTNLDEGHLAATRFYRPHQKVSSDADALQKAKLEAMGVELPEPRRNNDRKEMATDDLVMERFKKRMRR